MNNIFCDVRKLSIESFLNDSIVNNSESFIHKKYKLGHPSNALESTVKGVQLALKRFTQKENQQDDDAFFGVHIKETIRQFRELFGRQK
jgi:hypothetical protein